MAIKHFRKEIKGKKIDHIEISTEPRDSWVAVHFDDKTVFMVDLDPGLILTPGLSDWSNGNIKPIKKWPKMVA